MPNFKPISFEMTELQGWVESAPPPLTFTIFVVFFAYLPNNRSTPFALKPSYYQSKVWERFVSDYDAYT